MRKICLIILVSVFLIGFSYLVISVCSNTQSTVQANSNSIMSNKKIGWGIKRVSDHKQPDLGAQNKRLIAENSGMAMGNSEDKFVYLTFDQGYEAGYTEKILNTLKQNNITATFFITAHYLNTQEELVKKMIENGNIVGNHTVNHYSMPDLTDEKLKNEVMNLHTAVYEKTGYEMKYLRPPRGEYSEKTLSEINKLGYTTVMWSLAYDDWNEKQQKGEAYAKSKILDNIHSGAIILLHGNSKDNCNVLDYCIKEIKNMGYEFKSLDEFKE